MHKNLNHRKRGLQSEVSNIDEPFLFKQESFECTKSSATGCNNSAMFTHRLYETDRKSGKQIDDRFSGGKSMSSFKVEPTTETNVNMSDIYEMSVIDDYAHHEFVDSEGNVDAIKNNKAMSNAAPEQKHVIMTQNWLSLKDRFNSLFENWGRNKSIDRYEALKVALTYLENCDFKSKESTDVSSVTTGRYSTGTNRDNRSSSIVVIEIPKSKPTSTDKNKRFWVDPAANEVEYKLHNYMTPMEPASMNDNSLEGFLRLNDENCYEEQSSTSTVAADFNCKLPREKTLYDHKYINKVDVIR